MAFKALGSLLPSRLRQSGIAQGVQAARVVEVANEALNEMFGPETTQTIAQAVSYKMRRLYVASLHASFRQELKFRQQEFTDYIGSRLGEGLVQEIQFVI
jgi:hypothetical protein